MRRSEFKTLVTIGIIGAIIAASVYGGYIDFTPSTVSAGDDNDNTNTTTTVVVENPYDLPDGMSIDSASYIIYKNGTRTCAKNGVTGAIDHSGIDASYVINQAISSITSFGDVGRGMVYILKGEYSLASPIVMMTGIQLKGEGMSNTYLCPSGADNAIECGGGTYFITISDLTIGPADSGTVIGTGGIVFSGDIASYIQNVRVWYIDGNGITYNGGNQHRVENSYIEFCSGDGIYGGPLVQNGIVVSNCVLEVNGETSGMCGINITGGNQHRIVNNHIEHEGIGIRSTSGTTTIENNYIATTSSYGISLTTRNYNKVDLNTLQTCGNASIYCFNSAFNTITNNIVIDAPGYALNLDGGSFDSCVTNNIFGSVSGVLMSSYCTYNIFNSNNNENVSFTNYGSKCLMANNVRLGVITDTGSENVYVNNTA